MNDRTVASAFDTLCILAGIAMIVVGVWSLAAGGDLIKAVNDIVIAGVWMLFPFLRRQWLRIGYRRAATQFRARAEEARLRGLDLDQFIISEVEAAILDVTGGPTW